MAIIVLVDSVCIQEPREVVKLHAVQETKKLEFEGTLLVYSKFNSLG